MDAERVVRVVRVIASWERITCHYWMLQRMASYAGHAMQHVRYLRGLGLPWQAKAKAKGKAKGKGKAKAKAAARDASSSSSDGENL